MLRLLLVTGVLAVPFVASGQETDDDYRRIQGAWVAVSVEVEAVRLPAESVKGLRLIFEKDKLIRKTPERSSEAIFVLDPTKNPRTIDVTPSDGDKQRLLGIYQFEGETLKLCIGVDRPGEFASRAGSKDGLLILRRERP